MDAISLDCRNMPCPQPVIKLRALLQSLRPPDLEVIVDNHAALENVSRFLRGNGYHAGHQEEDGFWRISARADAAGPDSGAVPDASRVAHQNAKQDLKPGDDPDAPAQDLSQLIRMPPAEDMRTLALILAPVIGSGDDELGGRLMKNFLATLPEMGPALWRIILLNGGVKLAAAGSPVLKQLQALEKSGVSILVCGTCLEHFGLLEQKMVGESTNMLDVVTSMQAAYKIIRV
ncbi:sulfurtransferase-like selenium metabolism protein YedF [Desulfovibrio sp. OttesenSCG-928-G11]|nr:sulfurtransferase-like selenium metabolism protein YedF [Desulfovibrio sp. OttesenSCG-928-G11]